MLSPQLLRNIVRQIGAKKLKAVLSAFVADASNSSNNSNNAHSTLAQPTKKSTATNGKKNGKANLTELAGMDVEIGARTGVMQALDPSHARLVDNVNLLMRYVYSDLSSKSAQHIKVHSFSFFFIFLIIFFYLFINYSYFFFLLISRLLL